MSVTTIDDAFLALEKIAEEMSFAKDHAEGEMEKLDAGDTLYLYHSGRSMIAETISCVLVTLLQLVKSSSSLENETVSSFYKVISVFVDFLSNQMNNVYKTVEEEKEDEYYLTVFEKGAYADGQYTAYEEAIQALRNFLDNGE